MVAQVLEAHKDEVWHVQFSHSGLLLASGSKDATAQIWRISPTGEAVHMHSLTGHEKAVAFVTWSPDDSRLLTCGSDHEVQPHSYHIHPLKFQKHLHRTPLCQPHRKASMEQEWSTCLCSFCSVARASLAQQRDLCD